MPSTQRDTQRDTLRDTPRDDRSDPVLLDALRLLVLVDQLGENRAADANGVVRTLRGERRAQHLDHVVRHPATLAFLLMDLFLAQKPGDDGLSPDGDALGPDEDALGPYEDRAERANPADAADLADRRGALARRVRWLLAHHRRRYDPARRSRARRRGSAGGGRSAPTGNHPFRPFAWRLWDVALAHLQCRDLLRVEVGGAARASVDYGLTARASDWLEADVYRRHDEASFHSQVCRVVTDFLPPRLVRGERGDESLADRLERTAARLTEFRREQRLSPADDLAAPLFFHAFRERL